MRTSVAIFALIATVSAQECSNGAGVDSVGDSCYDWYLNFPETCGDFDTEDFSAVAECCFCGGGYACESDSRYTDTYGDGCDWYDANPDSCGLYDDGDWGAASDYCCTCVVYL